MDGHFPSVGTPPVSLWRNASFLRLWIAQTISGFGSKITALAIPLTATYMLHATPAQMGLLLFASQLPDLLFGLIAGVWVDRLPRRPILVGTDLGRAALLAIIPATAVFGFLSFPLLWLIAFASGALTLFFSLASVAVLPTVVHQSQLIEANARLTMSDSVVALAGPGAAGGLIQILSAPKAIIVDAFSYLASAFSLGGIAPGDRPNQAPLKRTSLRAELGEGLHELVRTPILLTLAISMGIVVVGGAMQQALGILFMARVLNIPAGAIGMIAASGGIGVLAGASAAGKIGRRFGAGNAIALSTGLEALALLLTPLTLIVSIPARIPLLIAGAILSGIAFSVLSVNQMSLRQRITPPHLLGRVTAARRFLIFCMAPIGTVLAGWLGSSLGLAPTLVIGALITGLGAVYVGLSPVRQIRN